LVNSEDDALWKRRRYQDTRTLHFDKGIGLMKTVPDSKHARHLFSIQVPEKRRDSTLHALQEKGIGVAVNFRAIHLLGYYQQKFGYKKGDFPIAEKIGNSAISLPLYPLLKNEEIDYVIKTVKQVIGHG
jgi:dTDP-4-amino-4,6-dideoxygalactose transaminase